MGRELRKVPKDWNHPKDEIGRYKPLLGYSFKENLAEWDESERTHFQMYENTTEGTPISPVMESPEALATWLAENNASAFGGLTATYDQWLNTIRAGYAPSAIVVSNSGLIQG